MCKKKGCTFAIDNLMEFKNLVGIVPIFEDKLLIVQRSLKSQYLPGQWSFICGHINYGESVELAVHRELKEEVSLEGEILGIIGINEWTWNENKIQHLQVNFVVKCCCSNVKLDSSCEKFKWVNPDIDKIKEFDDFNKQMLAQYLNSVYN